MEFSLLTIILTLPNIAWAENIQIGYGVSVDIPSHWQFHSKNSQSQLNKAGVDMTSRILGEEFIDTRQTLLAVDSINPVGIIVRVNIYPQNESQDVQEILGASAEELKSIENEFLNAMKIMLQNGGVPVLEMYPLRIETIGNMKSFVMAYSRKNKRNNSPTIVEQYEIPFPNYSVKFTFSRDTSEKKLIPIMDGIKKSVQFDSR